MVTVRDVAHRAGVSTSTVSHVLNRTRYVSDELRDRVVAAMRELEYHPNAAARMLSLRRSNALGLIVSDIEAAHAELVGRGIEVTDIWHGPPFPVEARQPGPDPERASYGSFCAFTDPDGNTWIVQEVTTRLPGR